MTKNKANLEHQKIERITKEHNSALSKERLIKEFNRIEEPIIKERLNDALAIFHTAQGKIKIGYLLDNKANKKL